MAHKQDLIGLKMPAALAGALGNDLATGLTATGSSKNTALALTANCAIFTTVAASTGALLQPAQGSAPCAIFNAGASALTLYPNGSDTINNGATSYSVAAGKGAILIPLGQQWIAISG